MDYFPAVGEFAEDQREQAVRRFAVWHCEMKFSADERCFGAEHFDAKVREFELSHIVPRTVVGCAVAIQRRLPAGSFFAPRKESQFWRVPVASHEAVEIVMVPGFLLGVQDVFDGRLFVAGRGLRRRG